MIYKNFGTDWSDLSCMIGRTIVRIGGAVGDEELEFEADDGSVFKFYYEPDCCASCNVNDIIGDLDDLIGSPLLMAEVVSNAANPDDWKPDYQPESYTWTFYRFATVKGYVTIRWFGESNGYYSESVSFSVAGPAAEAVGEP